MLFASNAASSLRSPSNKTFFSSPLLSKKDQRKPILFSNSKPLFPLSAFKIGPEDICEIAHNKVLVASALSCAIGQLSKSFFWAFNGAGIDLSAAVRSGGMPSTHSAGVAAAATSLALESM